MNKSFLWKSLALISSLTVLIAFVFSVSWAAATRDFTQMQKLEIDYSGENGYFGYSLDIQGDIAISGFFGDENLPGGASVFERENGQWTERQKLLSSNPEFPGFGGWSVAIEGDRAVVGSITSGNDGAAHIFQRINGSWVEQQILTSGNEDSFGSGFGQTIALQGNLLVVGAPFNYSNPDYPAGAAYIFEYVGDQWVEQQVLSIPLEGSLPANFGYSVAITGETIFIGALRGVSLGNDEYRGAVYTYENVNSLWTQGQKLTASDSEDRINFGFSVLAIGNTVVISATHNNTNETMSNAVYIFEKMNGLWVEQQTLLPDNSQTENYFGFDTALQGNLLVVTSPRDDEYPESGSVYIYRHQNNLWVEQYQLASNEVLSFDEFGLSTELNGETLMVGSGACGTVSHDKCPGAVYVYTDLELLPTPTFTYTPNSPSTTLPPTATYTPGGPTSTPEPTATNTPLPDGMVELLVNGSFELNTDNNQSPDGWKLKQENGDKLKCNDGTEVIAYEGICAFQFKGEDGENSKLQQEVDLVAHAISTGDTLTLGGQVWAKGDVDSKVTLKVKYGTLPTAKVVVDVDPTGKQWTPFSALQPMLSIIVANTPNEITLQIKNNSASGKVRYDALRLTQTDGLLALPQ